MFHKRKFKPLHPEKYDGDPTNIIMRSSWETRFASWCDRNGAVLRWSSEETVIPYKSPIDERIHRYFVDFRIQARDKTGKLVTYLVEVKPYKQTQPPQYPGRRTQRYLTESTTFVVNQAKWKAADNYAKDRGWEFRIITEYELGLAQKQ
jgi:hypothetical protein